MMKQTKKTLSLGMIIFYLFSIFTPVLAQPSDITNHPLSAVINKWIAKGLADQPNNGSFKPDGTIQSIEFFKYINRIFNFIDKSNSRFTDVVPNAWYSSDVAKAVAAGYLQGDKNKKVYPFALIKRAEAAVILAKVFELKSSNESNLNQFDDWERIAPDARNAVSALVEKGYFPLKTGNRFGPFDPLTRAESIQLMNNIMGEIANKAGTYSLNAGGNYVINTGGITLKNMKINGDLYLTEGIGEGNVTLENVRVQGKILVHGGGENSILFNNSTLGGDLVVFKRNGKVRIVSQGASLIPNTKLASGALLEEVNAGTAGFGDVQILGMPAKNQIGKLKGNFKAISLEATGGNVQLEGNSDSLNITSNADNSNVSLIKGTITQLNVLSDRSYIDLRGGAVTSLNINDGTLDSSVKIGAGATVTTLNASGAIDVNGQGVIMTANIKAEDVRLEKKPLIATNVEAGITAEVGGSNVTVSPVAVSPTGAGNLAITPNSVIAGAQQLFTLTYTLGDNLNNGSVVFNLPAGLVSDPSNTINIGGLGSTDLSAYLSSDKLKVAIPSVNLASGKSIVLKLLYKTSPMTGTYSFSVKADADGSGPRLASVGIGNETKSFASNGRILTWSSLAFTEAPASDGTITEVITGTLTNETFSDIDFDAVKPYTVSNVPEGLTVLIQRTSSTTITVRLTGAATLNANYNSISNLSISLKNEAFAGNDAGLVGGASVNNINVAFSGPEIPEQVTAINSSVNDGAYRAGQVIPITVTFSGLVNVTGTPLLELNLGAGQNAAYVSGSGTNILTFNYTVAPGDNTTDLDYTSNSALTLNGGAIESPGNALAANLTLPDPGTAGSLGDSKAIIIDTTAPLISGVVRDSNTQITVTLSEVGKQSTLLKSNAGGFTVFNTVNPANVFPVSVINPGATEDKIVLTVANMAVAGAAGVTVQYTAGGNGTVADTAGNILESDAGKVIAPWDTEAPVATVTVPNGTITDAEGQYVMVASSKGNGKVYIVQEGIITMVSIAALEAAVGATPRKGVSGAVGAAGVDVQLSTTGLAVGNYDAYAVDGAGNISNAVTGQITIISSIPPTLVASGTATVDNNFEITFATDHSPWRGAITSITIDGTALPAAAYNTTVPNKITFDPTQSSLLRKPGSKTIRIIATNYTPISVTQVIKHGAAASISMVLQPVSPLALGVLFQTQPSLKLKDQYGNDCTTDSTSQMTVSKGDAGNWTLGGTGTGGTHITATNGIFTFTDLTATRNAAVTGAKLTFSVTGLLSVNSLPFNLDPPTGNETTTISSVTAGSTVNPLPDTLYLKTDVTKITGTATNTNGDLVQVKVRIKQNSTGNYLSALSDGFFSVSTKVDLTATGTTSWSVDLSNITFANDTYTIEAIANDAVDGAISTYSFIVDKTAPSSINIHEPLANRIGVNGYVTLTAVNGPIDNASWTNIFNQIVAHTSFAGEAGCWISGIAPGSLSIIPVDGVTAKIKNSDSNIATIVDNFEITAGSVTDLAGNVAGAITIYSLISPSPNFVSAVTSTDGTKVEVSFDKAMNDPLNDPYIVPDCFTVTKDGVVNKVKTLTLKAGDNNTYVLGLTTALTNSQVIMVSYTQGVIRSTDNGILQTFDAPQVVENKVFGPPTVVSAVTTADGSKIEIKFSKSIDAQSLLNSDPNCFIVNTGVGLPVTGLALKSVVEKSTVVLTLQKAITSIQTVTVAYSPGAVKAEDNTVLAAFQPRGVVNNVIGPPDYYSSTTTLDGTKIEITFTKAIKDPNDPNDLRNYNNSFAVLVNNAANVVLAAAIKNSDPSTLLLTLSTPVQYGQAVTIAYVAGEVVSADGGILASFTKKNVTNAIIQPPSYVSSSTSTDGTKVRIKFDKLMGNPSTNTQNFKVNVSDFADMSGAVVDPITTVALDEDNQIIVLTLTNVLTYKHYVTVEYTPGDAKAQSGGILAAFTPKNVTNAVIRPPSPTALSSSDDGKKIFVTFSKTMAAIVAGDEDDFTVEIDGVAAGSPMSVVLKAGDSATYEFTLTNPIQNGQSVTFTYIPGGIKGWDGTIMEAFTSKEVTNNVMPPPLLQNATTTPDGTKIELTFDKVMGVPANAGFTVLANLAPIVVSTITLKAGDSKTLVLTLQTPIVTGDAVTISYDAAIGSIRTLANGILASFGSNPNPVQQVSNTVIAPPTITAASTTLDGTKVEITFSKAIAALPAKSETTFTVVNGGVANTVMSAVLKNGDNKTIVLTLKTAIPDTNPSQTVKVSYIPGTILASDNGILGAFSNYDVSNMVVGPPNFVSAATTTDGTQIEITFDRNMNAPVIGDAASFKVTSGTAGTVTGIALKNGNAAIVVLTLAVPVKVGVSTTVAYTAGTVNSSQGRLLLSFTAKTVSNTVIPQPVCTTLNTTMDGSALELKFDTAMADPQAEDLSKFAVTVDGNANPLDPNKDIVLKPGTADTILLYLTTPVNYGNVVKVAYTAGIITSTGNGALSSFAAKDVKNNVVAAPTYVSGTTTTDNTKIELKFSKKMGEVIPTAKDYFTVTTGGNPNVVSAVTLKAAGSDTLVLTLGTPVVSGQAVEVTYTRPAVTASDKIIAEDKGILASTGGTPWSVTNNIPATATVLAVTSTNPDGTYSTGQKVNITVTFSTAVTVTGSPTLLLETGATDQSAVYMMGSGTNTLTFTYTVQATDSTNDLNYGSTAALIMNGGTIRNTGTTIDAIVTLPGSGLAGELATEKAIKIDSTAPTLDVPVIVSNTDTLATLSVTSNRYGNVYFVVVPKDATIPNASQIKTGTDGWDFSLPVNLKGTIPLSSSFTGTKVITGLSAATQYTIYAIFEDTAGNITVTPKTVELTTDSGATTTTPTFITHNVIVKNSTTIQINLKIDINGKAYYVILPDNSAVPSALQIKAGTDSADTTLPSTRRGSGELIANTDSIIAVTGLTAATVYSVHIAIENSNIPPNLLTTEIYSQSISTNVPADTTAPTFTQVPEVSSKTSNTINSAVGMNEDGTVYYVALPKNSAQPSSAQVKLGLNAAGAAQTLKGSLGLTAGIPGTLGIIGLAANTAYDLYFAAEDQVANLQGTPTKVSVTTDSIVSLIPPNHLFGYPYAEGGDSFIKIRMKADKTGKAYYVLLAHGKPAPTSAQVKAGKDGLNGAPLKTGNTALTSNMEAVVTVTGLTVSTIYDIYVVAEDNASPVNLQSSPAKILMATNPLDLTKLGIDIAAGFITGTTTGMEYSFDATSGTTGTWTACGATTTSKVPFTYGKLFVREKANTSNFRVIANIAAPEAGPDLSSVSYNVAKGTITGMKNNMEYSNASGLWYPANTSSATTTVAFAQGAVNIRYKATAYTLPSDVSTLGYIFAQPAAPTLVSDDVANTITNLDANSGGADLYEYKVSGSWITGSSFKQGDFDGAKTVQVRLKATATTLAGFTQSLTFTANMDFSGVAVNISAAQINGTTTSMQYSTDSTTGLDGNWKNCTASVTNISLVNAVSVYVRATAQTGNFKKLVGGQTEPTTSGGSPDVSVVDNSGGNKTDMDLILANSLMEYSLDGGLTWTAHAQGTAAGLNLSAAPKNDLRVRYKATSTKLASLPTKCLNSFVDLSGVTMDIKNNTILGTSIDLEYSLNSTDGLTDGDWALCSAPVTAGLNIAPGKIYVRVADQPRNIKVFTVAPQAAAPVVSLVPTATNPGTTKLTILDPDLTYQYVIDTNATLGAASLGWGSATVVTGASFIDNLIVDTTKFIHIRIIGTTTALASAIKDVAVQIANIKPAAAPGISVNDVNSATAKLIWTAGGADVTTGQNIEFSYDGSAWTEATTGLTFNLTGVHVLYVRVKASASLPASNSTGNLDP